MEPLGEAKQDWQIIATLAQRMGAQGFEYSSAEAIFDQMGELTPSYHGISYEKIDKDGVQWPCKTPEDKGTPFLHKDRFTKGKGSFFPISYREPAELINEAFPFWLTTGRMGFHYHTRTMTGVSPSLQKEAEEGFMEMDPLDATRLGIEEGERVRVVSRRGQIETKVRLTSGVGRSVVFIPFHFVESAANVLTNSAFDPVAKIPEYKVCAVKVEKIRERMNT
jgi:predicted molibdopterin-dependent oxidoreductase YjgC